MKEKNVAVFRELIETATVCGWELPGQRLLAKYVKPYAQSVRLDAHGNLHAVVNGGAKMRVMLDGHCDEIGFMVRHIDNDGFLYLNTVGGVNLQMVPGERLVFQGKKGPVKGVVGAKAIHLMTAKERETPVTSITSLWADIGASSRKEAMEAVGIGAPAVAETGWRELLGDKVSGRAMDDRVGAFIVMDVLRRLKGRKLNVAVHAVSSTQEELGLLGGRVAAFDVNPHAGIAVDVTFTSDDPSKDEKMIGQVKLGGGPVLSCGPTYNRELNDIIERTAKKKKIPVQMQAEWHAGGRGDGTNAFSIRMARGGVAATLLSVPLRYMHTPVETLSLADVDHVAELMAETVASLTGDEVFAPTL
ncbi:MAG: M42 family peptidase [Kiritimatiellaeota bacterium]|nr:M42 family peptidase [Kiritimatiellota bacterium]